MSEAPQFTMQFTPATIDHLGVQLYSQLPAALNELVTNAYDAEAKLVEITVPDGLITESSKITIRDYGHGMDAKAIQEEYLPIARPRRGVDGTMVKSKNGVRVVTGRKGLGKLAAFGVARTMTVRSIVKGNAIAIKLSYDEMQTWASTKPNEPYQPTYISDQSGPTGEKDGTEIGLTKLRRVSNIDVDELVKGIGRRSTLIDEDFIAKVNGQTILPTIRFQKTDCEVAWDVSDLPAELSNGLPGPVTGWFGFLPSSSQADRGVNIYANKKAAEVCSFFNYAGTDTQFARAYLVGEVHADFLDGTSDLVLTARTNVIWESSEGAQLEAWGQKALIWLFKQWLQTRKAKKEKELFDTEDFQEWLNTRNASERRVARRYIDLLVTDPQMDIERARPLVEIVKTSVETAAFKDLLEEIDEAGADVALLLKLFGDWRIIESRAYLQIADGRLEALRKLQELLGSDALEVQEMQPLLESNIWIIDQGWKEADGQTTYTKLIRQHAIEEPNLEEGDKRLDIFAVSVGGAATVVEIKRPNKRLSSKDLNQIEGYVDWMSNNYVNKGADSLNAVYGLLVVGKMNPDLALRLQRLRGGGISCVTWNDLHRKAMRIYAEYEEILRKQAPEFARSKFQAKT